MEDLEANARTNDVDISARDPHSLSSSAPTLEPDSDPKENNPETPTDIEMKDISDTATKNGDESIEKTTGDEMEVEQEDELEKILSREEETDTRKERKIVSFFFSDLFLLGGNMFLFFWCSVLDVWVVFFNLRGW